MTAPTPTDRHRRLAAELINTVADAPHAADLERRVAELLAREDAGRVPIAAVQAAYLRGMRTIVRQAERYLTRHPHVATAEGVVGWVKAYEQATGPVATDQQVNAELAARLRELGDPTPDQETPAP